MRVGACVCVRGRDLCEHCDPPVINNPRAGGQRGGTHLNASALCFIRYIFSAFFFFTIIIFIVNPFSVHSPSIRRQSELSREKRENSNSETVEQFYRSEKIGHLLFGSILLSPPHADGPENRVSDFFFLFSNI